jgi:hypothetical protein
MGDDDVVPHSQLSTCYQMQALLLQVAPSAESSGRATPADTSRLSPPPGFWRGVTHAMGSRSLPTRPVWWRRSAAGPGVEVNETRILRSVR